jgi:hypothetical protein
METDPVSEKCFLEYRTMDRAQKVSNPENYLE